MLWCATNRDRAPAHDFTVSCREGKNRIQQDFDPIVYARIRGELYNNR